MNQNDDLERIREQALIQQKVREDMREAKPLWMRVRDVENRCRVLSTVPSAGISEYTTSGKTEGKAPPAQQEADFRDERARVEFAVRQWEFAADSEQGLGARKVFAQMDGSDKDKELLKWRGVKSFEVATFAPWLGSPKTVERARDRLGVRPSNGLELDDAARRRWNERKAA
jgi:hypothetical protein